MENIRDLLETARARNLVPGCFRGLLHIAIGRTVTKPDGTKISAGVTWRELAALLKNLRFDPELGREVGADPHTLSPRDRERYWYTVIGMARVDSPEALIEAEKLVGSLKDLGYIVGPAPGALSLPAQPKATAKDKAKPTDKESKKKKK